MANALADEPTFESRLPGGTDRFIAHMIEHAFSIGRRTSRDFLRHFPPATIMEALKDSPALRADILETATGVRRKVALKKSAQSSGEDLQIALEEGEALADQVVQLFRPDDRVRYLPRGKLWAFIIEGDFWKVNKTDKGSYERAQQHLAFMLDRALKDQVLSHQDIVEGITVGKLCQLMPRSELEVAMSSALALGRKGQPFSDRDLYDNLSSLTIAANIPLTHVWDEVVHPFIAVEHGLVEHVGAARADKAVAPEEALKQTSANTNDQPPAHTPTRMPVVKPVNAAAPLKRPQGAVSVAGPIAKPVSAKPSTQIEVSSDDEDGAFEVDFDNLTASKG